MTIVDVHTHMYPPSLMAILRQRTTVPYVRTFPDDPAGGERLIILHEEESSTADPTSTKPLSRGRPIGPSYHDLSHKLSFMSQHNISISVLSLANPWLDWLDPSNPSEAADLARTVNNDFEALCSSPTLGENQKLFHFATLPLRAPTSIIVEELKRVLALPHCRGIVMGTSGLGAGMDDPALDAVYAVLESAQTMLFLHPHYGLPKGVYGPRADAGEYGHILPLAMGFPMETTIAVGRMVVGGVFERFERLKVLVAHGGGALPFLAGRLESCVRHDAVVMGEGKGQEKKKRRDVWEVLRTNIFLDAVVYSEVALGAAIAAVGADRYGTVDWFPSTRYR